MMAQHSYNPRRRIFTVAAILMLVAVVLTAQLVRWTIWPQKAASSTNLMWQPHGNLITQRVPRGNILDRDGALLVTTGYEFMVSLTPMQLKRDGQVTKGAQGLAARLAPPLGMTPDDILARILKPADFGASEKYAFLKRVDFEVGQEIAQRMENSTDYERGVADENPDYGLPWSAVALEPVTVRVYPEGSLAAHTLGFQNLEPRAIKGIEEYYNDYLRGVDDFNVTAGGIPLAEMGERFVQNASREGAHDLILTIDRAMQYIVEQELKATVERYSAEGGTIMVMDPKTGGLLASASYPTYSPAEFNKYSEEVWRDPAISAQYEPGSIFKIITMAAGLNAGVVTPDTTYTDTGCVIVGGLRICNLDNKTYGLSTMQDVLLHSLNTGAIFVNQRLGDEFYAYVERFGFGALTQIDLAGEVAGSVHTPQDRVWSESDLGTNSFGQGIAVTPIQMAAAVSAVANNGLLMQPHVLNGIIANGRVLKIEPHSVREVIRKETASTLTDMLVKAVDEGAEFARLPGYSVAGKSGTAQIPGDAAYSEGDTIAGFVGYLPADEPAFVILVKIVRPRGETLGNKVAAPAFKNIAQQLVTMTGIAPDRQSSAQ